MEILRANGEVVPYRPANGSTYTLEELRAAIGGGYIEILATRDGRLMVVDDEGALKGLPHNAQATALLAAGYQGTISGDALVCDPGMIE